MYTRQGLGFISRTTILLQLPKAMRMTPKAPLILITRKSLITLIAPIALVTRISRITRITLKTINDSNSSNDPNNFDSSNDPNNINTFNTSINPKVALLELALVNWSVQELVKRGSERGNFTFY